MCSLQDVEKPDTVLFCTACAPHGAITGRLVDDDWVNRAINFVMYFHRESFYRPVNWDEQPTTESSFSVAGLRYILSKDLIEELKRMDGAETWGDFFENVVEKPSKTAIANAFNNMRKAYTAGKYINFNPYVHEDHQNARWVV